MEEKKEVKENSVILHVYLEKKAKEGTPFLIGVQVFGEEFIQVKGEILQKAPKKTEEKLSGYEHAAEEVVGETEKTKEQLTEIVERAKQMYTSSSSSNKPLEGLVSALQLPSYLLKRLSNIDLNAQNLQHVKNFFAFFLRQNEPKQQTAFLHNWKQ